MRSATKIIVSTLGVIIGIGGIDHGFLETLHGNIPTSGNALGEGNNWTLWKQGGEGAFTLIPNYLITGIVSIIVSFSIIIWSIGFIHRKKGSQLFLFLCILLFLVGGGVAQLLLIILTWAVSTRINKPLIWWQKILPKNIRSVLAKLWLGSLIVFSLLFLSALEIAIFGFVPGLNDPELILHICWSILGIALGILLLTFVSGFSYDIDRQTNNVI